MRGESVASLRGKTRLQKLPQQGTAIRRVYDKLREHAGHPVTIDPMILHVNKAVLEQLRTFYCCDITTMGHNTYVLTGEWDGKVYIDYVKQRYEKGT